MSDTSPEEQQPGKDALSQAEAILNEAADAAQSELAADEAAADDALSAAEAKAAEHLADLQRLQAEYVNYRKRVDRDRAAVAETATAKVVEALIGALDDIAAARAHGDLAEGPFASIADKLEETLGRFGWSSFGAVGEPFDPALHDALTSQTSAEVSEPTIALVAQPGHRIGERIIRPARVVVTQPEN